MGGWIGGRTVGGESLAVDLGCIGGRELMYSEFPRTPQPFNDSEVVDGHDGEEEFGAVDVAALPDQEAPCLLVADEVREELDVEEVFGVGYADEQGGGDGREEEGLGDGGGGEAGG